MGSDIDDGQALGHTCRELNWIPNLWETKKKKKTHAKENNHMHKTIFTWFGNLPTSTELQGFHYYQGRIQSTKLRLQSFFSHIKNTATTQHKTLKPESRFRKNGLNGPKKILPGALPPNPQRLLHKRSGLGSLHSMDQASIILPLKTMQHYLGRIGSSNWIKQN